MKPSEKSLQLAAQCWCDEETKNTVMDTDLAVAFAKRLDQKDEVIKLLKEALNSIASWEEGEKVDSYFDNPGDASTARNALEAVDKLEKG